MKNHFSKLCVIGACLFLTYIFVSVALADPSQDTCKVAAPVAASCSGSSRELRTPVRNLREAKVLRSVLVKVATKPKSSSCSGN